MFCPTKNLHFLSIHGGVDRVLPVCPAVNKKKKMSSSNLQVAEFAIPLLICSGVHLGGSGCTWGGTVSISVGSGVGLV